MRPDEIPEAWLQEWFERTALSNELSTAVTNRAELARQVEQLTIANKRTEDVQRIGLTHALNLCRLLDEAALFAANRSISLDVGTQMRPDVLLFTDSAHYLIVELKTRPVAERQGVQELLAYSAAMKLRYPYVNDFLYIVVAGAWEPLLARSVQALIMDGKRVLPLQWVFHDLQGPRPAAAANDWPEFQLKIRLDLFEMTFVQPYDPFFAMATSTLAVSRPMKAAPLVRTYFEAVARRAALDCQRLQQSGFVIIWSNPDYSYQFETMNTTLVTINQHWLQSEYLPAEFVPAPEEQPTGIARLLHKKSKVTFRDMTKATDPDDFWARSAASEAVARMHPQSSLSYEVLERTRNFDVEKNLRGRQALLGAFEQGDNRNLKHFLNVSLGSLFDVRLWSFTPFGELEDFAHQAKRAYPQYVEEVVDLLELFREHKGFAASPAVPVAPPSRLY